MCGIVCFLGNENSTKMVLEGLMLLQNRGYDSVGISRIQNNQLKTIKFASTNTNNSLDLLKEYMQNNEETNTQITIGHTRWATHGRKTDINAHPHHDNKNCIALVHNGIIENYNELKEKLLQEKYVFHSETDTEIIAVLIGKYLDNGESILSSIEKTLEQLKGTWALLIIHRDYPNKVWASCNGSPILLGMEESFIMIVSEKIAFSNYIKQYIVLNNNDLFEITFENNKINYNKSIKNYKKNIKNNEHIELTPVGYDHWTIKEIMEQPNAVLRAINNGGRILSNSQVKLGGLDSNLSILIDIDNIILLGCGTSYNSGLWALDIFKSLDIFDVVSIYDGADFDKKDIPKRGKTGIILISQSGETKDLHRCMQIIQDNNLISIGVVNVVDSYIARDTHCGVYLNAGREVAVASTKSFTNQCIVLSLIAIWFSQNKNTSLEKRKRIINDLHNLHFHIKQILTIDNIDKIKNISKTIKDKHSLFILGKGKEEAIAREGALKIKEITYIHAEGYSASALKHGPFGLIREGLPIILLDINNKYRDKIENVYQEVISRNAYVIKISDNVGDIIVEKNQTYGGILANVYIQLLSYYCSIEKGIDPDFPRNLAKVVSVE